jgi:hypothetical protein
VMIQGCERRCWPRCRPSMRAAWWFIIPAVGTPSAGSRSLEYQLGVPSLPVGLLVLVPPRPLAPWTPPRSVRGLLVGPRRPAPRLRARRGASVLRHHHHRVRCHHNHHHHRSRRCHHHLGVISPRAPAAAATTAVATTTAAATAAASKAAVAPLPGSLEGPGPQVSVAPFSISLSIMLTGLNPSFACQGFLPLCS